MAPETHTTRRETQEQSIKARKDELFEGRARGVEGGGGLRRPFRAYLHETPAAPLSLGVKASIWGAGAVVGLLFVAAIAGGHGTRATVPTDLVIPHRHAGSLSLTDPRARQGGGGGEGYRQGRAQAGDHRGRAEPAGAAVQSTTGS